MSATVRGLVAAAAAARGLTRVAQGLPAHLRRPWGRTNHAGAGVTLLEGPIAVGAALAGVLVQPQGRAGAALVVLVPGVLGAVDDLVGDSGTKGLGGHLRALRSGRVTTGALKLGGLGAVALAAAMLEEGESLPSSALVDAVVIAGTANLVNLLDLRPGRALKVTTATGLVLLRPIASRPLAGALVGTGAVLPEDLAGESMLGDCGANALGGLLGLALVRGLGPRSRLAAAAVVTGLTLLSERVSFTRVIEGTPVLREIDAWGRPL